ncbi:uncharacterized protein LOC128556289 [Mercenaria mercenaria]|uniref:uncharacterized protein LOC128556289 n=1 Tax=Mercenaria mercenaria TaxID=6596 RepID=UPI00234EDB30|nr:uncharacterized protein LOC128556289 [Mercenaria mercenaria]
MESWYFSLDENSMNVIVEGEDRGRVKTLEASKKVGMIKVLTTQECLRLYLEKFDYRQSGQPTPSSPGSRSLFVKRWEKYLKECDDQSTVSMDSSDSDCTSGKVDDSETDKTEDISVQGIQDKVLQEKFIGTFDVHVCSLCPPPPPHIHQGQQGSWTMTMLETWWSHSKGMDVANW